jgi:hypothetical protein
MNIFLQDRRRPNNEAAAATFPFRNGQAGELVGHLSTIRAMRALVSVICLGTSVSLLLIGQAGAHALGQHFLQCDGPAMFLQEIAKGLSASS